MPVFPKPRFEFAYDVQAEVARLHVHKHARQIPDRSDKTLLVATWNLANLGAQERRDQDRSLIAEIISWFDVVAIQECRENFADLFDIENKLRAAFRVVMSDASGNNERMAILYDARKLKLLEEIGELAFPPTQNKSVKLPGIKQSFDGFDRTPYLASFGVGEKFSIMLANVHLYFGDAKPKSIARRSLETLAVAKWADRRNQSRFSFTRELIAMGDFNMPKSKPGDPIFNALTKYGLELPKHSTQIASAIASDANYDQMAFLPTTTQDCFSGRKGVFNYDQVIFPELWQNGTNAAKFKSYLRYYITDHRPMWVELTLPS